MKRKRPTFYQTWLEKHKQDNCSILFTGPSVMMEPESAKVIWNRSLSLHNFRYTEMVGDGDSKTFQLLNSLKPYGQDVLIVKEECVNHVSK
ncbi:RNA 3p-terminal phosphate cyclase-like protein [Biomphalaria glabrata]|nr:hypothetical protein BgiMline_008605 [Biomphalaria glabrata]